MSPPPLYDNPPENEIGGVVHTILSGTYLT